MIACRAVGKFATGLILEGYASKGFHNKAKSCNWGPMAGLVLRDPRFTKAPEVDKQAKSLADAAHCGATEVTVIISEARKKWLLQNNCMSPSKLGDADTEYYFSASPHGAMLYFALRRTNGVQGANGQQMWAVNYALTEGRMTSADTSKTEKSAVGSGYLPVLAVRDPMCTIPQADFHSATTGDYDLLRHLRPESRLPPGQRRQTYGLPRHP